MKPDHKGIALLEVMVAVALLAAGVVTALQAIAFSSKASLYASELQHGCLVAMEWLDFAYHEGSEKTLEKFSGGDAETVSRMRPKPSFVENHDLSTPGFDAYDFSLEIGLNRMGKEETLTLKSLLVEKAYEDKTTEGPDVS